MRGGEIEGSGAAAVIVVVVVGGTKVRSILGSIRGIGSG